MSLIQTIASNIKSNKINLSIMTTNHLKMGEKSILKHVSNIPQTMDDVQHNICLMNQPLS